MLAAFTLAAAKAEETSLLAAMSALLTERVMACVALRLSISVASVFL